MNVGSPTGMSACDALVIGGGHNGLVAAAILAKGGLRTLLLERSAQLGGCAITSDVAPGFRCPTLAHRGALADEVVGLLDLEAHGLRPIRSEVRACTLTGDGRSLAIWTDTARTSREIDAFSDRDATRYPEFLRSVGATTKVLGDLLSGPAPDIDGLRARDLLGLLRTARRFRSLGSADAYRLLRWLPMSIADFTSEWFESAPLRATISADGVFGAFLGPRSAGSTAIFLLRATSDPVPIAPGWTVRGGPGAMIGSLEAAARKAGVEIRTDASVARVRVAKGAVQGVVLDDGTEIRARTVVSSLDPRRTLLGLVDPVHLPPTFARRVEHIRMRGTLAKVNFAVASLPDFPALASRPDEERHALLAGCIRLAPDVDAIERAFDAAKYGGYSNEPTIELTIPSLPDDSLAPPGHHVVSAYVQFAPHALRGSSWAEEREALGETVTGLVERHAPGFGRSVLAREVITPADLEDRYGLTGGHIFHGELALDQLFVARPLLGWARHRTPVEGLFLCGAGTPPGVGIDGRSGLLAAREVLRVPSR